MITWAYIAGFLDADGWITISKSKNTNKIRYVIGFAQSKNQIRHIKKIFEFIKLNGIKCTMIERNTYTPIQSTAPMINIQIKEQTSVVKFIKNVIPYLLIKLDKAKECFEYTKLRIKQRGVNLVDYKQKKKKYWTKKEINQLIKLQTSGNSNKTISNIMKRSMDSISHKLHRLSILRSQYNLDKDKNSMVIYC